MLIDTKNDGPWKIWISPASTKMAVILDMNVVKFLTQVTPVGMSGRLHYSLGCPPSQ